MLSSAFVNRSFAQGDLGLWQRPSKRVIKVNSDADVGKNWSSVAVVARDWRREVVFAYSKKVNTTIPLQAKAEGVLWAVQLSKFHGMDNVIFKSDSKMCMDAIASSNGSCPWLILNCILDLSGLSSCFSNLSFVWINSEANSTSHCLAKWSHQACWWGFFGVGLEPSCFSQACAADLRPSCLGS